MQHKENPRGVMVKMLDFGIVVSEFEFELCYDVMNLFILPTLS